jgi:hypothetical protein
MAEIDGQHCTFPECDGIYRDEWCVEDKTGWRFPLWGAAKDVPVHDHSVQTTDSVV